ncbi:MAG: tetratricopeptide repeat protein [Pikeienuella sp.]
MRLPATTAICVSAMIMAFGGTANAAGAMSDAALQAYDGGDVPMAAMLWRRCARLGDANAMTAYAGLLEQGEGAPHNPALANYWYDRAARRGDTHAMTLLAEKLLTTNPTHKRAQALLNTAASAGHQYAIRLLASSPGGQNDLGQGDKGETHD